MSIKPWQLQTSHGVRRVYPSAHSVGVNWRPFARRLGYSGGPANSHTCGLDAHASGQEDDAIRLGLGRDDGRVVYLDRRFSTVFASSLPGVVWATLAGNLIATLPAYQLNRTWTWGKRGRSHFRREIVPFWTMSFLSIAFSQLGAFWARHEEHAHAWSHLTNTALVGRAQTYLCFLQSSLF